MLLSSAARAHGAHLFPLCALVGREGTVACLQKFVHAGYVFFLCVIVPAGREGSVPAGQGLGACEWRL